MNLFDDTEKMATYILDDARHAGIADDFATMDENELGGLILREGRRAAREFGHPTVITDRQAVEVARAVIRRVRM